MTKTFSTKLDTKTLEALDRFCVRFHLKKSSFLDQVIQEGVKRQTEVMELAESIEHGLVQAKEDNLYSTDEAEALVFGKKKP
ncbi:MAG: hypothetical protein WCG06_02005 [Candidatus Omnitrophota bacterium]